MGTLAVEAGGYCLQRLYDAVAGRMGIEEALQDQYGGNLVDHGAVGGAGAAGGVQMAMSLRGAQALIPQVHREGEAFAKRLREVLGPLGLGTDVAGRVERVAEHDGRAVEPAQQAPQRLQVLAEVFANQGKDGLGGEAEFVGDRDADASRAEIEAEKAGRHTLSYRRAG